MNEWISVKERLPENDGTYLVVIKCPRGSWVECDDYYSDDKEWWKSTLCNQEESTEFVTHWMPLPEPPEEEA